MTKFLAVFLTCTLALTSLEADAARIGGGRSMGRQSGNVAQREAASAPAAPAGRSATQNAGAPTQNAANSTAATSRPTTAAPAAKRPWAGILGGLAAGLGLAWLANALGLGAGFGNVLLIILLALVALAAWRMFAARSAGNGGRRPGHLAFEGMGGSANAPAPAQYNPRNVGNDASARPWEHFASAPESSPSAAPASGSLIGSALAGSQAWGIPAGFDTEGFLSAAKRNFITLQDAWDRGDISTLRSMMTDGMVAEISSQLAERENHIGSQPNKTEVVTLDAQLLGVEELPDSYMASVEFSGVIREDASAGPAPFREVWNMSRPLNGGSGWLVAGVQALR